MKAHANEDVGKGTTYSLMWRGQTGRAPMVISVVVFQEAEDQPTSRFSHTTQVYI